MFFQKDSSEISFQLNRPRPDSYLATIELTIPDKLRNWGLVIFRELPGQHSQFLWCFPEKYFSVVQFAVGSDQRQRELRGGMRRKTVGKSERTHGRSNHCQGKQQQQCYKSEGKKTFMNPLKTRDNSNSDVITAKANNNNSFPFHSSAIL